MPAHPFVPTRTALPHAALIRRFDVASLGSRLRRVATGIALAASAIGPSVAAAQAPAVEHFPSPGRPDRPFSEAVRAGDLIFVAGQLGTDSTGTLVSGGIEQQTRQAMLNIQAILARRGVGMDRVAKCLVMLKDMAEWGRMNGVYVEFFPAGKLPARSAFGATALALEARVEIECIAVAP